MRVLPLHRPAGRRTGAILAMHAFAGIGAGLLFGLGLLMLDVAGIGTLLAGEGDGGTALIFLLSAVVSFAPVVICTAVGMIADGG